ncbi:MAG: glycosyltransferase [Pseudomonadota bacterium]
MSLPLDLRRRLKQSRITQNGVGGLQELDSFIAGIDDQQERRECYWQGLLDLQDRRRAACYFDGLGTTRSLSDQIAYAKFLWTMGDITAAHAVMPHDAPLGPKAAALSKALQNQAALFRRLAISSRAEVPARIYRLARQMIPPQPGSGTAFYTGQLGPGGAERQFAHLALALHKKKGPTVSVAVRHTDAARRGDFHAKTLINGGLRPDVLTDIAHSPDGEPKDTDLQDLLDCLHESVRAPVLKLAHIWNAKRPQSAFLWQDGGVLIGALAAALSAVPRIVTSFRGLPPNMRPPLYKPEYEPLYQELSHDPNVAFTSNSAATAAAYCDWLTLPKSRFQMIKNAVSKPSSTGNAAARRLWTNIQSHLNHDTKIVIGVFRCEAVKQPDLWFEAACRTVEQTDDICFIHVGHGTPSAEIQTRVSNTRLKTRIFQIGLSECVGFWLAQADLFLHLARQEGSPNAVIEAQLSRVPVLATPAGGTVETVIDKVSGCLFPNTSPSARDVADRIVDLLSRPGTLHQYADVAARDALRVHAPNAVIARVEELLDTPAKRIAA